jgi:hypothetical protein
LPFLVAGRFHGPWDPSWDCLCLGRNLDGDLFSVIFDKTPEVPVAATIAIAARVVLAREHSVSYFVITWQALNSTGLTNRDPGGGVAAAVD